MAEDRPRWRDDFPVRWDEDHYVTRRELAKFRHFETAEECFERHGALLSKSKTYRAAMQHAADSLAFAYQLQVCGYATDPSYSKKLVALITKWGLRKFDLPREEKRHA